MEMELLLDARNVILCSSLVMASGALFPEAPQNLLRTLRNRWKRFKIMAHSRKTLKKQKPSGSFWEIDMTKFEP